MGKISELEQVLNNTDCLNLWLSYHEKYEFLIEYDSYVKDKIRKNELKDILTITEWLIKKDINLFNEYDQYLENMIRNGRN